TDEKIQEIIHALKAENYIQAQGLIITYIETPTSEILQRTFQKEKTKRTLQDNNTIDDFNLFAGSEKDEETKTMDFEDMLAFSNETKEEETENIQKNIDFDSLLNIDKDDILSNNIDIDISHSPSETFWKESEEINLHNEDIAKDTFFDAGENIEEEIFTEKYTQKESTETPTEDAVEETMEEPLEELYNKEKIQKEENIETFGKEIKEELEELNPQEKKDTSEKESTKYKAIPYIDQKFKNMHVQYPPAEETMESFPSVDAWLIKISNEGYSEEEIEAMIKKIDSLSLKDKAEAAQLLLITAATESKYAHFRLARTLYKGEVLQKNLPESFTIINRLATNDDYPEAICDLAQFYEYGIGIDKDKKKAELLYAEAMDLGIKRAIDHYERIRKENGGLFSFLKK
ncbi:MAG: sel1 repeat family protein, partial [Thermotogaceae bacterium]|nr:sel1 repeat family protein [Thermotogaceae bacterium]